MRGLWNWRRGGAAIAAAGAIVVASGGAAMAAYNPTPTASWSPTSGTVYAIARVGNAVVIGGDFTALRSPDNSTTASRSRLAAFDASSGALLSWNPGANDTVRALESSSDGSAVFVGGAFTTAGGSSRSRIALLQMSNGAPVSGFSATANNTVYALKRIGSTIYTGGSFTSLNSTSRQRLGGLSTSSGSLVSAFNPGANERVNTLQASATSGQLLVGGSFTTLGGSAHIYIGSVSTSSGTASSWTPNLCTGAGSSNHCYAYGIATDSSSVYVAAGGSGGRLVGLSSSSGSRRWTAYTDGDVQAIAISGTVIYGGGHFTDHVGNESRAGMVALNSSDGSVRSDFAPRIGQGLGVFALLAETSALRVGGGFTHVDSTSEMRYTSFPVV